MMNDRRRTEKRKNMNAFELLSKMESVVNSASLCCVQPCCVPTLLQRSSSSAVAAPVKAEGSLPWGWQVAGIGAAGGEQMTFTAKQDEASLCTTLCHTRSQPMTKG